MVIFPARQTGSFDVSVHPRFRGTDLERRLTVLADEQVWRSTGPDGSPVDAIEVDVIDRDTKKRDLLAGLGYVTAGEPHQVYATRPLSDPIPEPMLPLGFTIRSVKGEEEADALGEVHSSAFRSKWPPGEYANVIRTPGYQSEQELVAVAPDGRLVAFLVYWPDHVSLSGLFEPVGWP